MAEVLVPVRLNIDHDGVKYRDTFTWNVNDTTIKVSKRIKNPEEIGKKGKKSTERKNSFFPILPTP